MEHDCVCQYRDAGFKLIIRLHNGVRDTVVWHIRAFPFNTRKNVRHADMCTKHTMNEAYYSKYKSNSVVMINTDTIMHVSIIHY